MIKQTINLLFTTCSNNLFFTFTHRTFSLLVTHYPLPVTDMVMREGGTHCVPCEPVIITSWRAAKIAWPIDAADCYISCLATVAADSGVEQLIKRKFKTMFNCHVHHSRDQLNGGGHDHRTNSFYHLSCSVPCARNDDEEKVETKKGPAICALRFACRRRL